MTLLFWLILFAALCGIFRPYLNGVTRVHFTFAASAALIGLIFLGQGPRTPAVPPPTNMLTASPKGPNRGKVIPTENPSAFEKKTFDGVSISFPKNWRLIGKSDSDSLNTNSEAMSEAVGMAVKQGNNIILLAAVALDDAGATKATLRLSVREGSEISQFDLREALKEPKDQLEHEIMEAAKPVAEAMNKMPSVSYHLVTGGGIRENNSLICIWTQYEYDLGKGASISDSWVCPASNRTLKLTASYPKSQSALFAATIDYVWRSLSIEPAI